MCQQSRGRQNLKGDRSLDLRQKLGMVDKHFKRLVEEHGLSNCPLMPAEEAAHWF